MAINNRTPVHYKRLLLAAKDFAGELTSHNILEKDLTIPAQRLKELVQNRKAVWSVLSKRTVA
jgi:DNA-damage-inducible protein D